MSAPVAMKRHASLSMPRTSSSVSSPSSAASPDIANNRRRPAGVMEPNASRQSSYISGLYAEVGSVPEAPLPAGPAGPSRPCGPTEPCEPAAPTGPTEPCGPCGPTEPCIPGGPTEPGGPCGPTGPTEPCAPEGPAGPGGPGLPTEPSVPQALRANTAMIATANVFNMSCVSFSLGGLSAWVMVTAQRGP